MLSTGQSRKARQSKDAEQTPGYVLRVLDQKDNARQSQSDERIPDHVLRALDERCLKIGADGKVVWRDDAPMHPKNWSMKRKIYDTAIITVSVTISALIGNTGTSAARGAEKDLAIGSVLANIAFASSFFFGQAFGGLFLPPYTESFGRKLTNVVSTAAYAVACIIVAAPQSLPAVIIGRFFSGFLSALPTVAGSGSIEDMWGVRARIWAIDIWIKGSIVGIALGPCVATYVSTGPLRWPWVYYLSAICTAVVAFLFLLTKESRPSLLLTRHIKAVQDATGCNDLHYDNADQVPSLRTFAQTMMARPIRFFFTEPIVCAVSVMSAVIFASIYLQTEGLTVTYQDFGFSERSTSLVYIAWIVGLCFTVPLRLNDWRIVSRRIRKQQPVYPEDKITGFFIAAPVLAVALWIFSWTVPPKAADSSPFLSMAALAFVGACTNEFDGILQGYLTDSYTAYAASANAPLAFLRGILSAAFPIFAKQMFNNLGSNVAGSILAIIASLFCFIAFWFWRYVARIREASKYAVTVGDEQDEKNREVKENG